LVIGEEIGFPRASNVELEIIEQGVLMTAVRASAAVEVGQRSFTVTRTLTINADERSIGDEVLVKGAAADLKDLLIGVRLPEFPAATWAEHPQDGFMYVAGPDAADANAIGFGVAFDPKGFVRVIDLPREHPGRAIVLRPHPFGGGVRSRQRLAAFSQDDPQVQSFDQFEQEMQRVARRAVFMPQVRMERKARLILQ
jgi:hypothetical protein